MTDAPSIAVLPLTEQDQFRDAVRLQKDIWQFDDADLLPARLFVVASKVGGQVFGAYHDRRIVGFALAVPGIKPGHGAYLHSQMVGVAAAYRNYGVGRLLKLAQRDDALARGIHLMEWTFDPLEIRNAWFNIERLGAVIRRFALNQYGKSTSILHSGLPTDRCIAEWWMDGDRVRATLDGRSAPRPEIIARIPVPNNIPALRETDPSEVKQIQARVSAAFVEALGRGLAVIGFERTAAAGHYLLGKME